MGEEYDIQRPGASDARRAASAVAAVPKLSVLGDLQLGGVGGGDAVAGLHAVTLLQLAERAHETSVGGIQRRYALLLHKKHNEKETFSESKNPVSDRLLRSVLQLKSEFAKLVPIDSREDLICL